MEEFVNCEVNSVDIEKVEKISAEKEKDILSV